MTRRQVRVATSFFDRLDELLSPERGAEGTPSATDLLLHDCRRSSTCSPRTSSDEPCPSQMTLRSVSSSQPAFLCFVAVYAVLVTDDAVELIYLELG